MEKEANRLAKAMTPKRKPNCIDQQDKTMSQDLAEIVRKHALGAAASRIGVAWLPGIGNGAALDAMVSFIWPMYLRINYRLGLKFSKVAMKSLACAVMSNLVQGAVSVVGCVYLAGMMLMNMLPAFAKKGKIGDKLGGISADKFKSAIKNHTPTKEDVKDARNTFDQNYPHK